MYQRIGLAGLVCLGVAFAQETPRAQASPSRKAPDAPAREETATFRSGVNLVVVPVVVRDKAGRAVGGLGKEDFQLSDRGKLQVISRFTAERPAAEKIETASASPIARTRAEVPPGTPLQIPEKFVAYLFDDIHVSFGDLVRLRKAAAKHLNGLKPVDRAAIFTTSGQTVEDFTDDRDRLHATLARLQTHPIQSPLGTDCPDMTYYMANMIQNNGDPSALEAAMSEAAACFNLRLPADAKTAEIIARSAASRTAAIGLHETRVTLSALRDAVRRISVAPGQRMLILASPGFITPENHSDITDILDRAIRSNVTISSIDSRGLWTDPSLDVSRRTFSVESQRIKSQLERTAASTQSGVLSELAAGTGGTFYQNSNDLDEGFHRVAEGPDYYYLLGFTPQELKTDGSFHSLKVSLKGRGGLDLKARNGYYAPKQHTDVVEQAKYEINDALFSRNELRELPTDMRTRYAKLNDETVRVSVLVHVDLKNLRFGKVDGRNHNKLTMVTGLFDHNGKYVTAVEKVLEMRLKDETLVLREESGITIENTLDVKPGTYLVRLVIRDSEGQQMSTQNGSIEIP